MTEFVRYSPGIEAPDPNFDSALEVVLERLETTGHGLPQARRSRSRAS